MPTKTIHTLTQYFQLALDHKASDLYITTGTKPALKINGDIAFVEGASITTSDIAEKYLSDILTEEQKQFFEERLDIDFSISTEHFGRFRVNAFLNKDGIGIAFRPISSKVPALHDLHLPDIVKTFANTKSGLVVVTGATGSGKSTTLAAIIGEINAKKKKHIVTIEDPIEFIHESNKSVMNQREVYNNTHSFHTALRGALRQSADVILVGEIRDPETMSLALEAAETGALVLTTLHTSGTAKAVDRMVDMFPFDKQNQIRSALALSLKAIIWQELLKRKDKKGRVLCAEVLVNNSEISNMIRKNLTHQIPSAIETGGKEGMVIMKRSLERLKEEGMI